MRLKYKVIVLAVLPLIAAVSAIAILVAMQARDLVEQQEAVLKEAMLAAKRAELQHYVQLARTSIDHLYSSGRDDDAAKAEAKRILSEMNYGDDGYFFAYDVTGLSLVHPRQTELVGRNLWDKKDSEGLPVIQRLIEVAASGDGFLQYKWRKPSSDKETDKLGYVVSLDRWGWVFGTGIYLDDVEAVRARLRDQMSSRITETVFGFTLVAVAALLIVFAGGMALNISEHQLADRQLKALAQRIVTLHEEERARVARDLHDGLSQLLVSVKYHLELAKERAVAGRDDVAEQIGKGLDGLGVAISEIRGISHNLRPSLLDNLGLPAALGQLLDEFRARTGIAVDAAIGQVDLSADEAGATTLYRIAQEALTNIERHAGAQHVRFGLEALGGRVRLAIADDGCGFDTSRIDHPRSGGIGLRNMRERIEHHGGRLAVVSTPGRTELTVELPCPSAAGKGKA
ncbi:cache domain-containing protein [Azoarcus sp. KH32C]|uniref:cache domain-containing protein n=1 Tax=Azoarcus sp. KH32C TaxID=748247 RepID=UPI0002386D99|nr:cache domain-containing protein [Azoarcus sp. KH32C]BAL24404.1 integral membrane sensor signal transduction histidine kinase [Azoarcus sp. KH32C]